ncbi:MAG: hypothetical protein E6F93_04775 [Actinobacteria bacterium]|nr:MAG: hypothetical protein E6F93_04775 [Actinomycetota bacterium]
MSHVECLAEQLSCFGASIAPPKQGAEVGKGTRSLQLGIAMLEGVDRLTEQELPTVTAGHDAGGALRHAERAPGQTTGEGLQEFGGGWDMLSPAGRQVETDG